MSDKVIKIDTADEKEQNKDTLRIGWTTLTILDIVTPNDHTDFSISQLLENVNKMQESVNHISEYLQKVKSKGYTSICVLNWDHMYLQPKKLRFETKEEKEHREFQEKENLRQKKIQEKEEAFKKYQKLQKELED